jgi:polysaccharide export outer membrane protein
VWRSGQADNKATLIRVLAAITLVLASCAANTAAPLPATETAMQPYRLQAGDVVRVMIYNQQSLSTDYKVGDNGMISMPLLGDIKAADLTVTELQKALYDGFSNGIFVNPGVSVEVSQYRPLFVTGEVAKPGQYAYTPGLNVLGAIAVAGGFTVRADKEHMAMIRRQTGSSVEWSVNSLTEVRPGDVIVVREHFF